jgi:GT2 family glycosyltransferase
MVVPHEVLAIVKPMSSNGNHGALTCSVVVCTNNRPVELEKCLAGVFRQALLPMEVLVVDNAHDERALALSKKMGARYCQEMNVGASQARNRGISESKGDIIAYLDDDACPDSDWLANLVRAFDDPKVMAVGGRVLAPEGDPEAKKLCALLKGPGSLMEPMVVDKSHPKWFEMTVFGGLGMNGNMAFRRVAFEHVSGFDVRLGLPGAAGEEQFAVFNLVDRGFKAAYAPGAVVTHPTSFTVEGLRARYFAACSYAISYIIFFFVNVPQYRGKLLKFLFEAMRGVKREWRGAPTQDVHPAMEMSRPRVLAARLRGVWLYFRSRQRHKAIQVS